MPSRFAHEWVARIAVPMPPDIEDETVLELARKEVFAVDTPGRVLDVRCTRCGRPALDAVGSPCLTAVVAGVPRVIEP